MRTLKELYRIVYDNYDIYLKCGGWPLCTLYFWLWTTKKIITEEEYKYLRKDFKNRKPSEKQYPEFYDKNSNRVYVYWWDKNDPRRKQFLKYLSETI